MAGALLSLPIRVTGPISNHSLHHSTYQTAHTSNDMQSWVLNEQQEAEGTNERKGFRVPFFFKPNWVALTQLRLISLTSSMPEHL